MLNCTQWRVNQNHDNLPDCLIAICGLMDELNFKLLRNEDQTGQAKIFNLDFILKVSPFKRANIEWDGSLPNMIFVNTLQAGEHKVINLTNPNSLDILRKHVL